MENETQRKLSGKKPSVDAFDYFQVDRYISSSGQSKHFHRNAELYCVLNGVVTVTIDSEKYELNSGDALFIKGLAVHSYDCENADVCITTIGTKYFQTFHELYPERQLPVYLNNKKVNAKLFEYLLSVNENRQDLSPLTRYACTYALLSILADNYGTIPSEENKAHSHAEISEIIQYIYNNVATDLSLESLAKTFNYSPLSLSHLFSRYLKMDIRNFINNIRIQNFLELRAQPSNKDKSIIELAMQCGFQSSATFYRAYKKYSENT